MPPDGVIVVMHPVSSLPFEIGERGPGPGVDQLFLIRREERFRYGIIVADSRPAERPPDIIPRAVPRRTPRKCTGIRGRNEISPRQAACGPRWPCRGRQ